MPASLNLLRERTRTRLIIARRHIEALPAGRGGEWKALLLHVLSEFDRDLKATEEQLTKAGNYPEESAELVRQTASLHLARTQALLDTLHFSVATYRSAVARSDVPVGLQHLIDVLIEDIVIDPGDPIIHLDARNMYSTIDLAGPLNQLITALEPPHTLYTGPHPIAFHLPALDPNNVLLSPVLAHEVAHTAVNRNLMQELLNQLPSIPEGISLQREFAAYESAAGSEAAANLRAAFQSWMAELICDATAVALTGPSFLFAFTAFAAPNSSAPAGATHPETHDRIRYALELVDMLGWTEFITARAPGLMAWLETTGNSPVLAGSTEETFLRTAMEATKVLRRDVAFGHISNKLVPAGQEARLEAAAGWLVQGVPLIDIEDEALKPWEAVLAGWLAAIRTHGDDSSSIALAAGDPDYNAVIVKALEYSQIVSAWRKP